MYMVDLYNRKCLHSYFFSNLCHIRLRLPKLSVTGKAAANPDLRLPKIGKQNKKKNFQFFKVNPTDASWMPAPPGLSSHWWSSVAEVVRIVPILPFTVTVFVGTAT